MNLRLFSRNLKSNPTLSLAALLGAGVCLLTLGSATQAQDLGYDLDAPKTVTQSYELLEPSEAARVVYRRPLIQSDAQGRLFVRNLGLGEAIAKRCVKSVDAGTGCQQSEYDVTQKKDGHLTLLVIRTETGKVLKVPFVFSSSAQKTLEEIQSGLSVDLSKCIERQDVWVRRDPTRGDNCYRNSVFRVNCSAFDSVSTLTDYSRNQYAEIGSSALEIPVSDELVNCRPERTGVK